MHLERAIQADRAEKVLASASAEALRTLFPSTAGGLLHELADHPVLALENLALAAERMNPAHVEVRAAKNRNGASFAMADPTCGSTSETIRSIGNSNRWVMLRFAEQLPEIAELLSALLRQIEPVLAARGGKAVLSNAFVFISSPGTLTPFHFDPEFNVFCQISGTKRFWTLPPVGPWLPPAAQEHYHTSGDNLLPWDETHPGNATMHRLGPGQGLFVPYKAPHWVEVEAEPSVSLQLTWRTAASLEQDMAWRCNGWLRNKGLSPAPPAPLPHRPRVRAAAQRLLDRLGKG